MIRRIILIAGLHSMFLIGVYLLLVFFNLVDVIPNNTNVLKWDSVWFYEIKERGYHYVPNSVCNLAFFPLFAYMWKLFSIGGLLICSVNYVLFIGSFLLFFGKRKRPISHLFFFLSLPTTVFFCLPYSESLFFVFGIIFILGLKHDNLVVKSLSLLGLCLTKSVSIIICPIILIVMVMSIPLASNRCHLSNSEVKNAIVLLFIAMGAIFIVNGIQMYQTGKWFYFLEVQKYWSRSFEFPSIPFTSSSPERVLIIDSIALIVGLISFYFCTKWVILFICQLLGKNNFYVPVSPEILFSAFFLTSTCIIDVFFTYKVDNQTSIWSIGRHILCSPFVFCFLDWVIKCYKPSKSDCFTLTILVIVGVFITDILPYRYFLEYYVLFFGGLALMNWLPKANYLVYPLYLINVIYICFLFQDFLYAEWIG